MKRLARDIIISYTSNVLILSVLFFAATYFFIGKNLDYMSKTQNQMNGEIISLLSGAFINQESNNDKVSKTLQKAWEYNIGLRIIPDGTGNEKAQPLNENALILRLEFGGRLVTKTAPLENSKGKVVLTYFRPFPASDDTVKFYPAFWRLTAMFMALALVYSWVTGMANAGLIKKDIKKAQTFTSNLVKGSFLDLTDRAKYTEFQGILNEVSALRDIVLKKEQLKKRMTADFAHELRTPLTTLQSHLEALIDGIWQPTTERFVSCHEEILRLIRLVGDLEKLSKFEDENIILQKSSFNFTELAKSICLNFQGELGQKKISLTFSGENQNIYADKDKISQVIVNLLSNSLKYTPRHGKILVDLKGDKNYVYLIINDSGAGIPAKDIPNVFNRLYRSDTSRTRTTGGAGIGLAVAKNIVEAHRGSIDVVSQEGIGTEITVIIPRR